MNKEELLSKNGVEISLGQRFSAKTIKSNTFTHKTIVIKQE